MPFVPGAYGVAKAGKVIRRQTDDDGDEELHMVFDGDERAHPHPAKFSKEIMKVAAELIPDGSRVLDPFAGTGRIHDFSKWCDTVGIEIEPEWASMDPRTIWGDSTKMDKVFGWGEFDVVFTSPTYGNRMADKHNPSPSDTSKRNTYKHQLGRDLHPNNSGGMQFGDAYKALHRTVWEKCYWVLKPTGLMLVNVSNHIRKGEEVDVIGWHQECLHDVGFREVRDPIQIKTRRQRQGANGKLRTEYEVILVFVKPADKGHPWSDAASNPILDMQKISEIIKNGYITFPQQITNQGWTAIPSVLSNNTANWTWVDHIPSSHFQVTLLGATSS